MPLAVPIFLVPLERDVGASGFVVVDHDIDLRAGELQVAVDVLRVAQRLVLKVALNQNLDGRDVSETAVKVVRDRRPLGLLRSAHIVSDLDR